MRELIFCEIDRARDYESKNGAEDYKLSKAEWIGTLSEYLHSVEIDRNTRGALIDLAECVVAAIEAYDGNGGFPCSTSTR